MLFATLIQDRAPLQWVELPRAMMTWVQTAGGVAALAALLWFAANIAGSRREKGRLTVSRAAVVAFGASWIGFVGVLLLFAVNWMGDGTLQHWLPTSTPPVPPGQLPPPPPPATLGDWLLTAAGGLALATILAPVLTVVVTRMRWGRIWAIASLSLKEAVRSKVVLIFGVMALVFLFADWFVPYKPENQVRNYVRVLYWSMTPLFLMTASLLGSFGIPTDVKSQSIHTIVTKPVEKFEVVLGRFLGYTVLITVGLAAVTAVSILYVARGVTEEAKLESFTAREPIYGMLTYHGTKGENVGRMYDVRGYITGQHPNQPNQQNQYASWAFDSLPSSVGADGNPVRFQFGFDIFRLTKGTENQGVLCSFLFADGRMQIPDLERTKERVKREFDQLHAKAVAKAGGDAVALQKAVDGIKLKLLEEHRMYVTAGFNVTDYHTQQLEVPAALFQRLHQLEATEARQQAGDAARVPMFQVVVSVDPDTQGKNQQMLGVARQDLYLLAAEHSFFANFVKGIVGLWCLVMLVLGVAVACSTYLSGVISWLCTIFFVVAGLFVADIQELADNRSAGGGPLESAFKLASRLPIAGQLDESPTTTIITHVDEVYRWWLRSFLNLVPDITRHDLHRHVAEGFDISWTSDLLLNNILMLLGYLFPWAILSFYLMKYREIANPM